MLPQILLAESSATLHQWLSHPTSWPTMVELRTWCQNMDAGTAALLILAGMVVLFAGYKMHRLLVALTFAVAGGYLGAGLMAHTGMFWIGMAAGAIIVGVVGWFFTAWSAAALGAVCGALLGAAVWKMANLDPAYAWSGALTGAVALGLLSFIIFRISVILFTAMQGSVMLVLGMLGMAYRYDALRPRLNDSLSATPMILPGMVLVLMLMGLGYQYLKSPAGKGGASSGGGKAPARATSDSKE